MNCLLTLVSDIAVTLACLIAFSVLFIACAPAEDVPPRKRRA